MLRDTTCKYVRPDGSGCQSRIVLPSGYCHAHDPERRPRLREVRAAGGRGKSRQARAEKLLPAVLRPILDQLIAALGEVHQGDLDPRQASAMAALAGAITRTYSVGQLEERLQALEQAAPPGGRGA